MRAAAALSRSVATHLIHHAWCSVLIARAVLIARE